MRFNLFQQSDVPEKYRSNFWHLYFDIAWFGVLSGTAVNFLSVYATRLGASGLQIGLLAAMAAVVNLFLAIPAGRWIEKRHTGRAVFWSSVVFRVGYVLWIPLPWLFDAQGQIWALIILAFLMAIPLTPLGVGFNALFAESVPDRFRAHVAGTRNVTFAIAYMLTSFGAGYILKSLPFETGYQVIFAIGAFGAAMSSYHIYHVRPLQEEIFPLPSSPQPDSTPRADSPRGIKSALRLDIWGTPFRNILLVLFFFHLHTLPANAALSALQCARPKPQRQQHRHRHSALLPDRVDRLDSIQAHRPPLRQQKSDRLRRGRHGFISVPACDDSQRLAILCGLLRRRIPLCHDQWRIHQLHARKNSA